MAFINDYLPREILVKIFSYYIESKGPLEFLRNVSPVCKLWNDLNPSYLLWKEVSLKSLNWNSDLLLKLKERGFLASTQILNLSCEALGFQKYKMIKSRLELKIKDFLQLIECCHNLKVLDVYQMFLATETTLQFIARKCPEYERFIIDPATHECKSKCEHSNMVSIDDGNKMISKSLLEDIQEKRDLDLKSRFAQDGRIISNISECCPFLEELHFSDVRVDDIQVTPLFPVGEIQKGCPKLQVLKIFNFKLDFSNFDELGGFKKIRTLEVETCAFFLDQDVGKIFKNSSELENLRLHYCYKFDKVQEEVTVPIHEIQRGCPKLRVLEIRHCYLEWSNDKELEGFKEIRRFSLHFFNTRGVNVGKILKNSTELEELRLSECSHLELTHATEIASEKVKSLIIESFEDISEHLEEMVEKWRLTLKKLVLYTGDVECSTRVLKALLQNNQDTVIEEIFLANYVDAPLIKSLIHDCQKLRYLHYSHKPGSYITLNTRQQLEEYAESM